MASELVRVGGVELRLHRGLNKATTTIPYPQNQQVCYIDESVQATVRKRKRLELSQADEDVTSEQKNSFINAFDNARGVVQGSREPAEPLAALANGPLAIEDAKATEEFNKTVSAAIKNLKATHSDWDRRCVDLNAVIVKSKANTNTCGGKIESDLQNLIEVGKQQDEKLLANNTIHLSGGKLTSQHINDLKEFATELTIIVQSAKQKRVALESSFKA